MILPQPITNAPCDGPVLILSSCLCLACLSAISGRVAIAKLSEFSIIISIALSVSAVVDGPLSIFLVCSLLSIYILYQRSVLPRLLSPTWTKIQIRDFI
jgi:hypothetical protein